jgi:hypothetical protein
MSLPIVIIFERHWDLIPKSLVKELLPELSKRGYGNFCFEAPENLSEAEIANQHNSALELDSKIEEQAQELLKQVGIIKNLSDMSFSSLAELLKLYVSSKRYIDVAEKLKQLGASRLLKEIFVEAAKLAISIKGIDIRSEDFNQIVSVNLLNRMTHIKSQEDYRIRTIFKNLLKIRAEQEEGIIFSCGAFHAKTLIDEFKKQHLQDEVVYYFPHSSSRYDESADDIKKLMNDTLIDHIYLLSQKDIKPFSKKIIREIAEKTRYTREIVEYNSHSQFLSDCFKTNFRAFLLPRYHVDGLLNISESCDIEEIQKQVSAVGVQTHRIFLGGQNYLSIPNINSKDIAEKIRKIPSHARL